MSRIGNKTITIPQGVEVKVSDNNVVTVKGKLGELKQDIDPNITVSLEGNILSLSRKSDSKDHKSKHGLYRALLNNMVVGVSEGFTSVQELVGVGYKAENRGQLLELALGFSHHIYMELPEEIKVETVTERGKNPLIKLTSCDKQLLGQVTAKIRSLRKPEPYKGKGVKFQGEELRKKAGKSAEKK